MAGIKNRGLPTQVKVELIDIIAKLRRFMSPSDVIQSLVGAKRRFSRHSEEILTYDRAAKLVEMARQRLAGEHVTSDESKRALALEQLHFLMAMALDTSEGRSPDLRLALSIAKEMNKVQGLDKQRIDLHLSREQELDYTEVETLPGEEE